MKHSNTQDLFYDVTDHREVTASEVIEHIQFVEDMYEGTGEHHVIDVQSEYDNDTAEFKRLLELHEFKKL